MSRAFTYNANKYQKIFIHIDKICLKNVVIFKVNLMFDVIDIDRFIIYVLLMHSVIFKEFKCVEN